MTPPKAVIFDCDGVIVDSEPATFDLLQVNLAQHGLHMTHAEMDTAFLGGTIEGVFHKARALGAALPDSWVADFYEDLYAMLALNTPLIPGVAALLAHLGEAGIPFAIGSNGTGRKMQVTLGQHPDILALLAGRLFSGQDLRMLKPAPDLYLYAARVLGVAPADCVVIEDSPTGARAAHAAGMRCMGYAPLGPHPRLAAEGAVLFQHMDDLPGLLGL